MNERLLNRIGWVLSALVILALLADAAIDLFAPERIAPAMRETGFAMSLAPVLGIICLVCALCYAIPRTAVLGAILITGFFGGAICTHLRVGDMGSTEQFISLGLGALAWGGIWCRDRRVRGLLPFRS